MIGLSDLNQPYSCTQWGNTPDGGASQIVHDTGYDVWDMFQTGSAFPSTVWIDHTMKVYDKMNNAGSWSINSRIESMLEDCGECYVAGTFIDDDSSNSQSYQEYCCEEFGGEYFENSDPEDNYCVGSDANWVKLCSACTGTVDSDGDGLFDECDDCFNMSGDLNEDMVIDVLDIVSLVNIILNVTNNPSACVLSNADSNSDGIINVQDIILVINSILGLTRNVENELVDSCIASFDISEDDMLINFDIENVVSGMEIKFSSNFQHEIYINNNEDNLYTKSNVYNGIQHFIAFSLDNRPLETIDIVIKGGSYLIEDDINLLLSSTNGQEVPVVHNSIEINSFTIENVYPNPFNPSTEISYNITLDGFMNVDIYNILGQKVDNLYSGYQSIGNHKLMWSASSLSSGVYYIYMNLNGQSETYKSILLK